MSEYDEAYSIVVDMSRVKMTMNSHKGRIETLSPDQIRDFCKAEVDELHEAMQEEDMIKIIEEAGDVLNFAVAAVQQAINKYRGRPR